MTRKNELSCYMQRVWTFRKFILHWSARMRSLLRGQTKVLDNYFVPETNVPFERHLFMQIFQASNETVDQFVCNELRQRAASCDFGESEDDYFCDQLIDKCYSSNLRRKFLEQDGAVTLDFYKRLAGHKEQLVVS